MYDTAIIGTGPAGLSAAINLKLHDKSIVWFGPREMSGKLAKSEKIANYPGLGMISGAELNAKFKEQADGLGLEITEKIVTQITRTKDGFTLLAQNEVYEAKSVLIAAGVTNLRTIRREGDFLGIGVSYCATCDGFFYKGKTICVYSSSAMYVHEISYLASLASKVYLYTTFGNVANLPENVEMIARPVEITGEDMVEGVILEDGNFIKAEGIFCLREAMAVSSLIPELETEGPHILTDKNMRTNIPGCFAAGDCTGLPYQIAKAVGEGNIAAHSIISYLKA